ncbi:sensor domain-containing protein [Mycobacterium sp. CVI_P3]|uniref:Sensor domain-containing protein n=1 Tax=Mycobacterium pinniadriaticum TaxID=2994102 RepID=A0ABT3SEY0_9MYCO|nr:sensor domain-containing protein [Mycobacterium pinniadriaticum]MCX2931011.1 sensor domain-containing protein [Mycobacterium pinniadriaticum]MCX2937435.1 sensor domain-containing protein [Mycobacterium pinniadriaticum]
MLGIAVLAGCSDTVGGTAVRPMPSGAPRDLAAILPSGAEVSQAAGNPLADSGAAVIGGIDVLPDGIRDDTGATPIECLGPVSPFMRVVYEGGDVRGAGWQEFSNYGGGQTVSSVDAGVVEFDSDAEAQRMFGAFVTRWKACEGTTVTTALHNSAGLELYQKITDVTVDGAVLSATVVNSDNQGDATFPTERAVGLADDCVVDVDVAVTAGTPAQQSASGRAVKLVATMRAKVAGAR